VAALSAISTSGPSEDRIPDLEALARIFSLSAALTKKRSYVGGEMSFRAAACTGALYHIDLYLVCGDLPDLEAGVYHFGPHDFALRRLRQGDYRGTLREATAEEATIVSAPAIVICTSTYWRNAWKYKARTYRHCYWDSGTILANLLAATVACRIAAKIVCGFIDDAVNRLLSLDTNREVALSLVSLGRAPTVGYGPALPAGPLDLKTVSVSKKETDYPSIRSMHLASSLHSREEVLTWRGEIPVKPFVEPRGRLHPIRPLAADEMSGETIEEVIRRRGSTRQFAHERIGFDQLSTMLDRVTRGIPADFLAPDLWLNDTYLIVHAVEDLPAGAYFFRRDLRALELLKEGNFRREAGYLGLEQELATDASVDVFFLADLRAILERFGNRGYRAAQLEASIIGGKLYLSAYAQGLGASGLTFYDDDVTEFFSPHATAKSVMFLVALGRSLKRKTK
jgi:SagB-type dehydrogenase family enzyme